MIRTLSHMYVQVLGNWARPFFLLGAWAILFKTLYVATAANSRMTADFLRLGGFVPATAAAGRERTVKVFCVIYPLLSLAIFLSFREPLMLIAIGGAAQALMLPLIAGATLYLRYRDCRRAGRPIEAQRRLLLAGVPGHRRRGVVHDLRVGSHPRQEVAARLGSARAVPWEPGRRDPFRSNQAAASVGSWPGCMRGRRR